jgi:hypothetical protein
MNWKGFGRKWKGLIEILSCHQPGELRKTIKNLTHDSQCAIRDSNPAPHEYKFRALLLNRL